jgi:hypothetical protein
MMKDLKKILLTAIVANLLTIILYLYAISQPGGSGTALVFSIFEMPALWLICLIVTVILVISKRKNIFKRVMLKWTIPVLLFCTPIPLNSLYIILQYSNTYLAMSGYNPRDGITIKDEEWCYTNNHKVAVHKFFKLESEDYSSIDDSLFKKDSVWVYLSAKGDTTKIERYKNGTLVSIIQKTNK